MTRLEELKFKRKASIIVVCTLGFGAIISSSIRPLWLTNIFEGTSIGETAVGSALKYASYAFLAFCTAAIMLVIYLGKLIYYQIEISKLTP